VAQRDCCHSCSFPNNISRVNKAPAGKVTSRVAPTTDGSSDGGMPVPGRMTAICSCVNIVPAEMSTAATRLFRATAAVSNSDGAGSFRPWPRAASTDRIPRTIAANSSGSNEARWSGPVRVQSRVKCFSITVAPKATAAMASVIVNLESLNFGCRSVSSEVDLILDWPFAGVCAADQMCDDDISVVLKPNRPIL